MDGITIELNKKEFAGGETVAGEVIVRLDQDTRLRGIRLKFEGYERTSWTEGSGKNSHTHSEKCSLFDEEFTLHGNARLGLGDLVADSYRGLSSKERYELFSADTYRYPFSYVLPQLLPGNYKSARTNSQIYYGVKASVDLPLKSDLKAELPLVVHEPVPAATQSRSERLVFDSESRSEAAVHLAKDTLYLGETLQCRLDVTNRMPSKRIRAATLALRQLETAHAKGRTHDVRAEVSRARFEDCQFPPEQCVTLDLALCIPGDLAPTVALGSLLRLRYELLATLDIPWATDALLSVPVTLIRAPAQGL